MSASLIGQLGSSAFQAIHHFSVDVAPRLSLLVGIGTKALPSSGSKARQNNLWVGLAVRVPTDPSGRPNLPRPSSRKRHLSTAQWSSSTHADLVSPSAGSAVPKIFSHPQAAGRLPHLWCPWRTLSRTSGNVCYVATGDIPVRPTGVDRGPRRERHRNCASSALGSNR